MSRGWVAGAVLVALVSTGCAKMFLKPGRVELPEVTKGGSSGAASPVVVCKLVDARPPELSKQWRSAIPTRSATAVVGVPALMVSFGVHGESGAVTYDDAFVRFAAYRGSETGGLQILDDHLRERIGRDVGAPVAGRCAPFSLHDVDRSVPSGGATGLVIVPILDQLGFAEVTAGEWSSFGGSSSEETSPGTVTTTSQWGSKTRHAAGTASYANVRMRWVVLKTEGGRVVDRRVLYGRGWVAGSTAFSELARALRTALDQLSDGLSEVVADR